MIYVCLVEAGDKLYLLIDDEGNVLGGEDKQPLRDYWTKGWESGLARGGTWSTSAMLSFIQFRPSIIQVPGVEDLPRVVGHDGPYDWLQVGGMAGGFGGILCESGYAKALYEEGERPEFFKRRVP